MPDKEAGANPPIGKIHRTINGAIPFKDHKAEKRSAQKRSWERLGGAGGGGWPTKKQIKTVMEKARDYKQASQSRTSMKKGLQLPPLENMNEESVRLLPRCSKKLRSQKAKKPKAKNYRSLGAKKPPNQKAKKPKAQSR